MSLVSGEVTSELASWAAGVQRQDLPPELVDRIRSAFVDTAAAILSGIHEPVTIAAANTVREDGASPRATQLGAGLETSAESAAFLNAISGHALDYDDVSASVVGHPSVVLFPAALAVAESTGAPGADLVTVYAIGHELMARLSVGLGPAHYARGWHATATLGTVASAAACGRLFRLDERRIASAMAIAVSEAAGSRRNFGTMTKPFHAGHAARCGVSAARLAAAGVTGDAGVLEGPMGFFDLFGGAGTDPQRALRDLGATWDLLTTGLSVKKYPCCFAIHRAADAVIELRQEGLDTRSVESLTVRAPVGAYAPLNRDWAETGLEGKFSLRYALASALLDGTLCLDAFTDEAVHRPVVRELMQRVSWLEDPAIDGGENPIEGGYVAVEVVADGRRIERRVDQPLGSPARPIGLAGLEAKLLDCARGVLNESQARVAFDHLIHVDQLDAVDELVASLCPTEAPAAARER
jgi:2-methylcitrate dehydratase PrpD